MSEDSPASSDNKLTHLEQQTCFLRLAIVAEKLRGMQEQLIVGAQTAHRVIKGDEALSWELLENADTLLSKAREDTQHLVSLYEDSKAAKIILDDPFLSSLYDGDEAISPDELQRGISSLWQDVNPPGLCCAHFAARRLSCFYTLARDAEFMSAIDVVSPITAKNIRKARDFNENEALILVGRDEACYSPERALEDVNSELAKVACPLNRHRVRLAVRTLSLN